MSLSHHDAIIICLDVGKSVSVLDAGEDKTFFERSKECVSWIIQRKLIAQSQDVLSLLLIGSNDTDHSLTSSGYKNISCKFEFQNVSWEMLKFISFDLKTSNNESDWIGALVISMELLKTYEEFNDVQNKRIVFFSNFACPASDDLNVIAENLKKLNANITIIGPENILDIINTSGDREPAMKKMRGNHEKSQERLKGEELICEFWKKVPDLMTICSFQGALKQLCSYTRKVLRKTPWNCLLDIGDIKISISMFKKTDPKPPRKFETKVAKSSNEYTESNTLTLGSQLSECEMVPVVRDKVMHYKHDSGKGEFVDVEVTEDDIIKGFRYGNSIIPFGDADKEMMNYKPGPKCFSVIGFTSISSVPFYLLSGECSYLVLPRDKDQNAEVALSALVQAMNEMQYLAVVRRVYSDDRGLYLGILYPFIEEISKNETDDDIIRKECLIYIELAFKEELKSVSFPPLEKFGENLTKDQCDAVDSLIDSMNLMTADKGFNGEPSEAFDPSSLHDFKEQFYNYCVIQRGLYPDKPLPVPVPNHIKNYINVPEFIEKNMKIPLRKLKESFRIVKENVKGSGESSYLHEASGNVRHFTDLALDRENDPIRKKVMKLFSRGFPTEKETKDFLLENSASPESVRHFNDVIGKVRHLYFEIRPDPFNFWMEKFKSFCHRNENVAKELWAACVKNNTGLISNVENKNSHINKTEADDFLHSETTKSLTCGSSLANYNLSSDDELDEIIKENMRNSAME